LQKAAIISASIHALIFVALKQTYMDHLVVNLVSDNGSDASQVAARPSEDCDSIFVMTLDHSGKGPAVTFIIEREGLNGQNV
jgi:hypothetical protein